LTPETSNDAEAVMLAVHFLAAIVVLLVLYLFYAVINPEKF